MTVSSTSNRNDYTGNGATGSYSYTYRIFQDSDLLVTVKDTSDVESTLTLTTDYTVSGATDLNGGSITLVESGQDWMDGSGNLKNNYELTIRRVVQLTQLTDIRNQGVFFPEIHEDQFDKSIMADQQQQDEIDRAIKLPETVPASEFDPVIPANALVANTVPVINATGNGFVEGPTTDEIEGATAASLAAQAAQAAAEAAQAAAEAAQAAAEAAIADIDDWVSATAYTLNDMVVYRGVLYRCVTANSDVTFTKSKWEQLGGHTTEASTQSISSGGDIAITTVASILVRVAGNAGAQTASTTPFGTDDSLFNDGQEIIIEGTNDTNTVTIQHNDAQYGCILNGDWTGGNHYMLTLVYNETKERFIEKCRNL